MATRTMTPGMLLNGRYRLDVLLSETGNAKFWRGTDTVLGRDVAINAVPTSEEVSPRLMAAARDSATVHDPRLLRVLDCDDRGDVAWVVHEWGSGVSLDILLQRGPLDPTRAAWLALETAQTIETAHAAGVCHGRLTPEAVLVTHAGAVKIIGFAVSASIEGGGATKNGPYGHLEPHEADVIDLASVLYAALTGKWPGASPSAVPAAPTDQRGPLRPRQVRHGVPRMLDTLCDRVLRQGAHEHAVPVGSAVEIVAALTDFLGSSVTGAPIDVTHMHEEPVRAPMPTPAFESRFSSSVDPDATQASAAVFDDGVEHEEPELPPFEDSAERPLFASTPRRPALAAEPGRDPEPQAPTSHAAARRSAGRTISLVLLALAVVVAMVFAYRAGADTDSARPTHSASPSPLTAQAAGSGQVPIVSAQDFDPLGTPAEENPDKAELAIDGSAATGWPTSSYFRPNLGGLKPGVGLVLDLGTQVPVSSVQVTLGGTTSLELRPTPTGVNSPPVALPDVTAAVAATRGAGQVRLTPKKPVTTRFLVLWITDLPRVSAGRFRAEIMDVQVRR